jgi:hypothetical protein
MYLLLYRSTKQIKIPTTQHLSRRFHHHDFSLCDGSRHFSKRETNKQIGSLSLASHAQKKSKESHEHRRAPRYGITRSRGNLPGTNDRSYPTASQTHRNRGKHRGINHRIEGPCRTSRVCRSGAPRSSRFRRRGGGIPRTTAAEIPRTAEAKLGRGRDATPRRRRCKQGRKFLSVWCGERGQEEAGEGRVFITKKRQA